MTALLGPQLTRITDSETGGLAYQISYSTDWTGLQTEIQAGVTGVKPGDDAPNQVQYPDPPTDQTMLTSCTYHVITAGATTCPVMFISGTVKPTDAHKFYTYGWNIANH